MLEKKSVIICVELKSQWCNWQTCWLWPKIQVRILAEIKITLNTLTMTLVYIRQSTTKFLARAFDI